jgi:UDP-N-acetylglucosamine:LPS N-acetylglucosamine transferase
MASAYGRANVVVCSAGATTLAELASLGKPAVLVPYPFAADDHQRANAKILVDAGAAQLILDKDLNADRLATALEQLLGNAATWDSLPVVIVEPRSGDIVCLNQAAHEMNLTRPFKEWPHVPLPRC